MSWKKNTFWIIGSLIVLVIVSTVAIAVFQPQQFGRGGRYKRSMDMVGAEYALSESGNMPVAAAPRMMMKQVAGASAELPRERKLIKKGELNLEVSSADDTAKKIIDIVNACSGIIVDSSVEKYQNEAKKGITVLKVQPKDFEDTLAKIKAIGKLDSQRITGEDVTEEYVDLEARLKNFQMVKDRLTAILQDKARTVKDILEVERELARVGEQIESIQGRMKYLDRQVDLATITVNYYEPSAIAPETLNVFKKLKETIRRAVEAFINVFNAGIIVIFALLPILIWLGIIFFLVVTIKRLFFKKK